MWVRFTAIESFIATEKVDLIKAFCKRTPSLRFFQTQRFYFTACTVLKTTRLTVM